MLLPSDRLGFFLSVVSCGYLRWECILFHDYRPWDAFKILRLDDHVNERLRTVTIFNEAKRHQFGNFGGGSRLVLLFKNRVWSYLVQRWGLQGNDLLAVLADSLVGHAILIELRHVRHARLQALVWLVHWLDALAAQTGQVALKFQLLALDVDRASLNHALVLLLSDSFSRFYFQVLLVETAGSLILQIELLILGL